MTTYAWLMWHTYITAFFILYTQVPLGILENKHEDMISILDHLHQYVPTLTSTETVVNPHTSKQVTAISDCFHYVLFGGDLLTAKRARGGQEIRENSNRGRDRLEGLAPIMEDWHTKMCLISVSIVARLTLQYTAELNKCIGQGSQLIK